MATSTAAPVDRWQHEWALALESLELDVDAAESLLGALHGQSDLPDGAGVMRARWEPPGTLGPIPRPLVERARTLLRRQHQVAEQLVLATRTNRRHAHAASRLTDTPAAVPVYVDVAL